MDDSFMADEFWQLLKSQPGVGVLILDDLGVVLYCNDQARKIYYGDDDLNPVGQTIEDIEGPEFSSERMAVIRQVLETKKPIIIHHVRGGKNTEAVVWPMEPVPEQRPRVIAITRQGLAVEPNDPNMGQFESKLVDLGPLDVLTRREIQVLALIGHGVPQKKIAADLGVAQRTVERYRTDIARKLRLNSIAEIAQIVQAAGLSIQDADLPRLHRWKAPH